MAKVESYDDKKYDRTKELYDVIAQIIEDLKYEQNSKYGWNMPSQHLKGITARFLGQGCLEVTFHRFEVCTIEGLRDKEAEGRKFLDTVAKEIKKRFKKVTKKTLDLKKISDNQALDKYSRLQADTSWMLGSSRYGYGNRPVGRYLVRDARVYQFDEDVLE